jgi:hypothetical protein
VRTRVQSATTPPVTDRQSPRALARPAPGDTLSRVSNALTSRPAGSLGFVRARLLGAPAVSGKRRAVALTVAVLVDVVQIVLWPAFVGGAASPFDDALDAAVALILLGTLGVSGRLALALGMELVPGADLFPTWSAVVLSIPVRHKDEAASASQARAP